MKRRRLEHCRRCGLWEFRRYVVRGRGELPCDVLEIGEAPGRTENLTGIAFHGRAGKLLDRMNLAANLDRYRLYITNVVMCRPCEGRIAPNREPLSEEVLMCMANVRCVIEEARPKAVVLLGEIAQRYYGREFPYAVKCYHPSYLLRTGSETSPDWWKAIRMLEAVHRRLERHEVFNAP